MAASTFYLALHKSEDGLFCIETDGSRLSDLHWWLGDVFSNRHLLLTELRRHGGKESMEEILNRMNVIFEPVEGTGIVAVGPNAAADFLFNLDIDPKHVVSIAVIDEPPSPADIDLYNVKFGESVLKSDLGAALYVDSAGIIWSAATPDESIVVKIIEGRFRRAFRSTGLGGDPVASFMDQLQINPSNHLAHYHVKGKGGKGTVRGEDDSGRFEQKLNWDGDNWESSTGQVSVYRRVLGTASQVAMVLLILPLLILLSPVLLYLLIKGGITRVARSSFFAGDVPNNETNKHDIEESHQDESQ